MHSASTGTAMAKQEVNQEAPAGMRGAPKGAPEVSRGEIAHLSKKHVKNPIVAALHCKSIPVASSPLQL